MTLKMSPEANADLRGALEPLTMPLQGNRWTEGDERDLALLSIAISLKRIADLYEEVELGGPKNEMYSSFKAEILSK